MKLKIKHKKEIDLRLGDSKEVLKGITSDSVDMICTDPPYGYSFMGKDWDKGLPDKEIFKECFRILKPGAFACIMSAPRTDVYWRMCRMIEEAGFKVEFTPIVWAYACLSEDTEVYTKNGWISGKNLLHNSKEYGIIYLKELEVLIYDRQQDMYKWETPDNWNFYKNKDTAYRIKSNFTDQIVSRGHRVIVAEEGKLLYKFAEEIKQSCEVPYMENMQRVSNIVFNAESVANKKSRRWELLFNFLQVKSQYKESDSKRATQTQNVRRTEADTERTMDRFKKYVVERRSYIQTTKRFICQAINKIREVSTRIFGYGKEGRLCYGTQNDSSKGVRQTIIENGSGSPHRPQRREQQFGEFNAIQDKSRTQTIRNRKSYKTTMATVKEIEYDGNIFCPTVFTGCFVARRKGKIFLTGNSGFPKAGNIGKMVDKRMGVEVKEGVGFKTAGEYGGRNLVDPTPIKDREQFRHKTVSVEAKALDGSYAGFQPKPAVEMVIVAMKPITEKTYVDQALKRLGEEELTLKEIAVEISKKYGEDVIWE